MAAQNPGKSAIKIVGGKPGEYPLKLEIIPGRLFVTIFHHQLLGKGSRIPCWTFVSQGMAAAKQKEIVLTIRLRNQDNPANFPKQPLQFFMMVYKSLLEKKRFEIGDVLSFGDKGLFGFGGVGFTFVLFNDNNIKLPNSCLTGVLLNKEETLVAQNFGLTRVLSRFAFEMNNFPLNPWNDLERNSVPWQTIIQTSVLRQVKPVPFKYSSLIMHSGESVVLVLPAAMQAMLVKLIKAKEASGNFAISTQQYPYHEGSMVWLADKELIEMNVHPDSDGELIAGSFLLFQLSEHTGASMLEDGFQMQFDPEAWENFKNAVLRKQNAVLPSNNAEMNFKLIWSSHANPEIFNKNVLDTGAFVDDAGEVGGGFMDKLKGLFSRS